MPESHHIPVLLDEVITGLQIKPDGVYVDGTFGYGGHSFAIASRLKKGKVIGFEVDKNVYEHTKHSSKLGKNVFLYNRHFVDAFESFLPYSIDQVDGILFDLGTNVVQIKESGRGFSFVGDEPLDMRLDLSQRTTAADIVNSYTRSQLEEILQKVDESFYKQIAKSIVETRAKKKILTSQQLVEVVERVKFRRGKIHPATLTFMALRIETNDELGVIEKVLPLAFERLKPGGRLAVISFHSGEDTIVKHFFKEKKQEREAILINKKVIIATREEERRNPPSRSAKLRILEKTDTSI
ncbi:MAG: 16S rRNA (cytosine(1402)-N(4))-methyltransferase RsmH [Patescibacteria group bacterium]